MCVQFSSIWLLQKGVMMQGSAKLVNGGNISPIFTKQFSSVSHHRVGVGSFAKIIPRKFNSIPLI